jgi:hypothetical protein
VLFHVSSQKMNVHAEERTTPLHSQPCAYAAVPYAQAPF